VYRHWLQEKGGEGMHTLPRVVNVMRAATPWGVEREEEMVGGESTHAHLREGGGGFSSSAGLDVYRGSGKTRGRHAFACSGNEGDARK
jgi:hypothetical protein